MTDLERKLADALREQADQVTPNLDAAWAEQQRRQRRPRRRRLTVVVAPLAAVLVVLTSVLLATRLNDASPPAPPAHPGDLLTLPQAEYQPMGELKVVSTPVRLIDFAGQTDRWTPYAFIATTVPAPDQTLFCVAAVPENQPLDESEPQYATKSPSCAPISSGRIRAGYVGETGGPLPPGKAVYLVDSAVVGLVRLFDEKGGLSTAKPFGAVTPGKVYLATVDPGWPPVRFDVS
ncbi:hypothetical protein SAMN05421837_10474 [Amycolatopsis pretoriensis]|uniref:Uncharacterized protein n=1 Tax=Amycolatopsis pretoriensis TaxID=218821 RepID=A0A1H5QSF9_9PSEU|nr:hypothetical protein [Amycolatopsis pretoriensis]SEF28241.1 hypothetical protein SAMN05421837_10474 [Amycolatopsis pretoriensis]